MHLRFHQSDTLLYTLIPKEQLKERNFQKIRFPGRMVARGLTFGMTAFVRLRSWRSSSGGFLGGLVVPPPQKGQ